MHEQGSEVDATEAEIWNKMAADVSLSLYRFFFLPFPYGAFFFFLLVYGL